jgi:hypothetical protein
MSRQDELRAKAERLKQRQEAKTTGGGESPVVGHREERTPVAANPHVKPIRNTVDLPPVKHAELKSWCGETAVMVGRSRVTTQDVLRALVGRLLTDETLARKVRDDLRKDL